MEEMAVPTVRFLKKLTANGRFYYTGSNVFMTNKAKAVDETLAKNPFYEKYAKKITSLQQ